MGGLDSLDNAQHTLDAGLGVEHDGYQLYVSVDGKTLLDVAGGEARPGVAMDPSTITMWFSSGKVVTAIAVAQLWEQGRLGLDDRVVDYLPAFTNGKERATVRHLLTHTAGFPYADDSLHPPEWPTLVQLICDAPAMWEPGTAAGYHGTSAHVILGELVRVVDGRPIAQYAAEEVFAPLGITDSYIAIPPDELDALRPRLAEIRDLLPKTGPDVLPGLDFEHYNTDEYLCAISPGNTCRGPARDLGRVYGYPWGLGVALDGNGDVGSRGSGRVFGCSGAFSSVGFADPENGLVCLIVTNGLIQLDRNEDRLAAVANHVQNAVGSR